MGILFDVLDDESSWYLKHKWYHFPPLSVQGQEIGNSGQCCIFVPKDMHFTLTDDSIWSGFVPYGAKLKLAILHSTDMNILPTITTKQLNDNKQQLFVSL